MNDNRPFDLVTSFQPAGDQPQAIEKLVNGIERGYRNRLLLGVTGSGKTYTMANVIAQTQRPTIIMAHNKTRLLSFMVNSRPFSRIIRLNTL